MKKIISFVRIAFYVAVLQAQTWIWYPGDYEIWLGNRMNNRRTERGAFSRLSGRQTVIMW